MPFQPINFANIAPIGKPWARNFAENLRQGFEMGNLPQKLMGEREQQALANALQRENVQQQQAQTPYAPQNAMNNASILQNTANFAPRMSEAEIKQKEALAAMGGLQLPGGAGLVQSEEHLARMYGRNSPEYKRALSFNNALERQRWMANTPEATKLREDEQRIMNDPNLSAQEKEDAIGYSRAKNVKNSIIPELEVQRTRAEITSEGFNKLLEPQMLDALTQYSGVQGGLKRLADEWEKQTTGNTPERLLRHEDAMSTAEGVAMNLRAAIKESVSPARSAQILDMISPSSLSRSPAQAVRRLKAAAEFFETEKKAIDKATGRGGAHNETIKETNAKALKQQQEAARKATGVQPKKNAAPTGKNLFWDGSKFVEGGFPK